MIGSVSTSPFGAPRVWPSVSPEPDEPQEETTPSAEEESFSNALDGVEETSGTSTTDISPVGASGETDGDRASDSNDPNSSKEGKDSKESSSPGNQELTTEEELELRELQARDQEVRAHEQAHKAAGGQHTNGGPSYEYETGPDGQQYAVGGEVSIDVSPVAGDPEATIQKAQVVRRAALAPAEPSGQDRRVAASASAMEQKARGELAEQQLEETREANNEAEQADEIDGTNTADQANASETAQPSAPVSSSSSNSSQDERSRDREPEPSLASYRTAGRSPYGSLSPSAISGSAAATSIQRLDMHA